MKKDKYLAKAESYLKALCGVKPNRRTGSSGNRDASDFFADTIRGFGYTSDTTPFKCLDYIFRTSTLMRNEETFEVHGSPYTLGCDVQAELVSVMSIEELEHTRCEGKILLMRGEICAEQLMPKNFVFYNPAHHKKMIALLESKEPAAIITATGKKPEMVGALYPYPLFVDGDFDIPSVYCKDTVGDTISEFEGDVFLLRIDAERLQSSAANIIAKMNGWAPGKIIITAHIDAYEDSPGASDNAAGTVTLLLLAEMLSGFEGHSCVEIAALNGEDHYSAGGQMDYLNRYGSELDRIRLAVNVDDVGYRKGRASYSFYECGPHIEEKADSVFRGFDGLVRGDKWYSGDHMIFVQNNLPALAFTSECMPELMKTITHTRLDTPDIIDCRKLVVVAEALNAFVRSFKE
jgi:aminopeptidase YwaD